MRPELQKQTTFTESLLGVRHHANYFSFNEPCCLVGETTIKRLITQIFI